jgi:hypothetical protein
MAVCKRVGSNCFDYYGGHSYALGANSKRSLRVAIYGESGREICTEAIAGLTTRHAIIRAHRFARRYIDRLLKDRKGANEMRWMIRDIQPENVL